MLPPKFWSQKKAFLTTVLRPLGLVYGLGTRIRLKVGTPTRLAVPVICIGNLTVGGSGKTPVTKALAEFFQSRGKAPAIISRGYGGCQKTPHQVNPNLDTAESVGDEPLLLARTCPTWVGANRLATAQNAIQAGADLILMDDGYQNPVLHQDIRLLLIDGVYGFGNMCLFPTGPLREFISDGLQRAHGILMLGKDHQGLCPILSKHVPNTPFFQGSKNIPQNPHPHKPYIAFSGIAQPEQFFTALRAQNYTLIETKAFPDHHPFNMKEIESLKSLARARGATLLTTEKDAVRLPADQRAGIETIPLHLEIPPSLLDFLHKTLYP